ncbi:hypothetical protein Pelo_18477 [Pelomyxa schiedti]|nr:hypothetical protein Pelo_18477 [Pelomyxa schiedti]
MVDSDQQRFSVCGQPLNHTAGWCDGKAGLGASHLDGVVPPVDLEKEAGFCKHSVNPHISYLSCLEMQKRWQSTCVSTVTSLDSCLHSDELVVLASTTWNRSPLAQVHECACVLWNVDVT